MPTVAKTKSQHGQRNDMNEVGPFHRRIRKKRSLLIHQPNKSSTSKLSNKIDKNRNAANVSASLDLSHNTKSNDDDQEVLGVLRSSLLTPVSFKSANMASMDTKPHLMRRLEGLGAHMFPTSITSTTVAYNTGTTQDMSTSLVNSAACVEDSRCSSGASQPVRADEDTTSISGRSTPRDDSMLDSVLSSMNALDLTGRDRMKLKEIFAEMTRPSSAPSKTQACQNMNNQEPPGGTEQRKLEQTKDDMCTQNSPQITTIKGYQHTTNSGLGFVDSRLRSPEEAMQEARLKIPSVARLELQRSKSIVIGLIDQEMNKALCGTVQIDAADAITYVQRSTESAKEMAVTEAVTDTLIKLPQTQASNSDSTTTTASGEPPSLEKQRGKLTKLVKLMRRNRLRHIQSELKQLEELDETIDL